MRTEKLYEMQKTVDDMRKSVYEYFQPVIKVIFYDVFRIFQHYFI